MPVVEQGHAFGLVLAGGGAVAVGHVEDALQLSARNQAIGGLPGGVGPAVHGNGAVEVHGGAGQQQHVVAPEAQLAQAHAAQVEEMLFVVGFGGAFHFAQAQAAVLVLFGAQLQHQGPAAEHGPAQAHKYLALVVHGQSFNVQPIILARNLGKGLQVRVVGQQVH